MTQKIDRRGIESEMTTCARREAERHRGQHSRHVTVPEAQHVAGCAIDACEHGGSARCDVLDRLAARDRPGPNRPARPLTAPSPYLGAREPFELAVVPLREVLVFFGIAEARELGGLARPRARAHQ